MLSVAAEREREERERERAERDRRKQEAWQQWQDYHIITINVSI